MAASLKMGKGLIYASYPSFNLPHHFACFIRVYFHRRPGRRGRQRSFGPPRLPWPASLNTCYGSHRTILPAVCGGGTSRLGGESFHDGLRCFPDELGGWCSNKFRARHKTVTLMAKWTMILKKHARRALSVRMMTSTPIVLSARDTMGVPESARRQLNPGLAYRVSRKNCAGLVAGNT